MHVARWLRPLGGCPSMRRSCVPKPDGKTARLRAAVEAAGGTWREAAGQSEAALAAAVRADEVDVLLELTGARTSGQLPGVTRSIAREEACCARKPRLPRARRGTLRCPAAPPRPGERAWGGARRAATAAPFRSRRRPHGQQPAGQHGPAARARAADVDRLPQLHGPGLRAVPPHGRAVRPAGHAPGGLGWGPPRPAWLTGDACAPADVSSGPYASEVAWQ
jgi:hypothetical protein